MIGDELDTHLDLLDETDHLVDRTENRLGLAAKRLAKVAKGTKGCGKCFANFLGFFFLIDTFQKKTRFLLCFVRRSCADLQTF